MLNLNTHLVMLDTLLPEPTLDMDAILNPEHSQHTSHIEDITIRERVALHFEPDEDIGLAFDIAHSALPDDGWRLDLGADLTIGVERARALEESNTSIEVGRDAVSQIQFAPDTTTNDKTTDFQDPTHQEGGFGNDDMNIDFLEATPIARRVDELAQGDILFQVDSPVVVRQKRVPDINKKRKLLIDNQIELHSTQITQQLKNVDDILIAYDAFVPITLDVKRLKLIKEISIADLLDFNNRLHIPRIYRSLYTFDQKQIKNRKHKEIPSESPKTPNIQDASFFEFGETGFGNDELNGFGNDDTNVDISMIHPHNVYILTIKSLSKGHHRIWDTAKYFCHRQLIGRGAHKQSIPL